MKSENGKVMSWHSPGEKEEKNLWNISLWLLRCQQGGRISMVDSTLSTGCLKSQLMIKSATLLRIDTSFFDSVSLLVYMTCHENAVSLESRGRLCFCGGARTNSPTPFFIETLILLSGKYPYMTLKTVSFSILYASNKRYWLDCEVLQNSIEKIFLTRPDRQ